METPAVGAGASPGPFVVQYGLPQSAPAPGPVPAATLPAAHGLWVSWTGGVQAATALLVAVAAGLLFVHALVVHPGGSRPAELRHGASTFRVDINKADLAQLQQLDGIGPVLAERILAHREQHGPFARVEDLLKVKGIGPATLQRLRPRVAVGPEEFDEDADAVATTPGQGTKHVAAYPPAGQLGKGGKKEDNLKGLIDLNRATQTELQLLPGIGPKLSQRIIEERQKRPFATVGELDRVYGIGVKTVEKLRPFVTVGG